MDKEYPPLFFPKSVRRGGVFLRISSDVLHKMFNKKCSLKRRKLAFSKDLLLKRGFSILAVKYSLEWFYQNFGRRSTKSSPYLRFELEISFNKWFRTPNFYSLVWNRRYQPNRSMLLSMHNYEGLVHFLMGQGENFKPNYAQSQLWVGAIISLMNITDASSFFYLKYFPFRWPLMADFDTFWAYFFVKMNDIYRSKNGIGSKGLSFFIPPTSKFWHASRSPPWKLEVEYRGVSFLPPGGGSFSHPVFFKQKIFLCDSDTMVFWKWKQN